MTDAPKTEPRRRWLGFSLRTLSLLMPVLCVALGWKVERARKQREAVEWVAPGGAVTYDYQARVAERVPGTKWLRKRIGIDFFDNVQAVDFQGGEVSDVTRHRI